MGIWRYKMAHVHMHSLNYASWGYSFHGRLIPAYCI
jgi:hypothetical protein